MSESLYNKNRDYTAFDAEFMHTFTIFDTLLTSI